MCFDKKKTRTHNTRDEMNARYRMLMGINTLPGRNVFVNFLPSVILCISASIFASEIWRPAQSNQQLFFFQFNQHTSYTCFFLLYTETAYILLNCFDTFFLSLLH